MAREETWKAGSTADESLTMMGEFQKSVEMLTGFKRQFIDAGWSEESAEELVVEIFRKSQ